MVGSGSMVGNGRGKLPIAKNILKEFVQGNVAGVSKKGGRGRGKSRGGKGGRSQPTARHAQLSRATAKVVEQVEDVEREMDRREEREMEDVERELDRREERDMEDVEREMDRREEADMEEDEGHGGEEGTSQGASSSSSTRGGYLRGPSKLPKKPDNPEKRIEVKPYGDMSWEEIAVPGKECRPASGILGRLLKDNFPGMVKLPSGDHEEPPFTWHHYKAKVHGDGCSFAQRVKDEFWQYYKCADGYEHAAEYVMEKACKKHVYDMHYEVRIQSVINYHFEKNKVKLVKKDARAKTLTKEEYMQVPPRWVINEGVCWEKMVDKWCTDEWKAKHEQRQLQRGAMIRIPHHQGSRNLKSYGNVVSERLGQPVSEYEAYASSHKGKASVVTPYNDSDPKEAYTSLTSYAIMQQYKDVFGKIHGADSDPIKQPLDPEVVMVAGEGKKHGRFAMGGSLLSTACVPTLPQIKARQTRSSPAIRSRPTPIQLEIEARVAEERCHGEKRLHEALAENKRELEAGFRKWMTDYCAENNLPTPAPAPTPQTRSEHTPEGGGSNDHRTTEGSDNNDPPGSSPQF